MKRLAALLLTSTMLLFLCACGAQTDSASSFTLNEVPLSDYTIVYAADALDYTARAASFIHDEIYDRTGAALPVVTDDTAPTAHEIVVGETNRPISAALNEELNGLEFSILAHDGHLAMEADYFVIAAAAYYFINTSINSANSAATMPTIAQVHTPIVEKASNYILLIGDGMGSMHTTMPEHLNGTELADYTDGEKLFYGKLLPYSGYVHTNSLEIPTDSAAASTALATGFKTANGRIGRDKDGKDLLSITELAGSLGMSTAVMSTEGQTGATPSGFSAHADDRDDAKEILASQKTLQDKYGTIIEADYDLYTANGVYQLEQRITSTLNALSQNKKGFFMMYEEAYIDKHSHDKNVEKAAQSVLRFNQAIGRFMEFAFYHPDTFLIITADHETGGLIFKEENYKYQTSNHTSRDVPVFAYGMGAEVFNGKMVENVQIPKTIASMWGQALATATDEQYPVLK